MSLSGFLDHAYHFLPLRVYYEDTDAGGIVYHANYLKFAERSRTEMLRCHGINREELEKEGFIFIVRHISVDYLKPAVLYDDLVVRSCVNKIGGASMTLQQDILKDGVEICQLTVTLVCVDENKKPIKINTSIKDKLLRAVHHG